MSSRRSRITRNLVYLSYSHKDKLWHRKLRRVLEADPDIAPLLWDDTMLPAATEFKKEFADHLARARIIIMLVTEDYISPKSGAAFFEMFPALEMRRRGENLAILWVPVKPHNYSESPLGDITAATGVGASPLECLTPHGQAKALQRVRHEVRRLLGLPEAPVKPPKPATPNAPRPPSRKPPEQMVSTTMKTIVELDLKAYSDIARELEDHFSADLVLRFNEQIQSFVAEGIKAAGVSKDSILATTGDGAIIAFDQPSLAHIFAEAVHTATRLYNHEKGLEAAKRWFRIGIATGDLAVEEIGGVRKMAGSVIARAVRLEAAGQIGEILVDAATYASLSREQQACYGAEEQVAGKRDEKFAARRYVVIAGLVTAAAGVKPNTPASKPNPAIKAWEKKIEFLETKLATVSNAAQEFEIKSQIDEAKEKIAELQG